MKKSLFLPLAMVVVFLSSCTQYAYFQSPLHSNSFSYKEQPLKSENRPFALYGGAAVFTGSANQDLRDQLTAFNGTVHAAHQFGNFQAFYGTSLVLGGYLLKPYPAQSPSPPYYNSYLKEDLINPHQGRNSFGALSVAGGINYVKSLPKGGEWRIIGIEANWSNQWGEYQDFRSELPENAANLLDPKKQFMSVGISTDFVGKIKNGSIGYKLAGGALTRNLTRYSTTGSPSKLLPVVFSQTLHYSYEQYSAFTQVNLGYGAVSFHFGLAYRLH